MEGVIAKSASVWQQKFGEEKMTKDELKLAFQKAFQMGQNYWYYADHEFESYNKKSDAIRAKFNEMVKETIEDALAQPEQEPVAWRTYTGRGYYIIDLTFEEAQKNWPDREHQPLYTTPPQRTWVGLMRGVRVEGDTVVISVKGGNDAARELCGALIEEMNR
jgi:hypothetical protein